jgi:hydrogenase maturation protease
MPRILIVAYGNPLRCDDGIAWRAADALEGKFAAAEVEILRLHQLAPELAETVSRFGAVIFVDAAARSDTSAGEVGCEEIFPSASENRFTHQLSPHTVLSLAAQLYGACPRAFCVTSTGLCFEHGDSLSPEVAASLPGLVSRIEALVRKFLGTASEGSQVVSDASRIP